MPDLIAYVLIRLAAGFALGSAVAVYMLLYLPHVLGNPQTLLEMWLPVYGLGSSFALSYLATGLAQEH